MNRSFLMVSVLAAGLLPTPAVHASEGPRLQISMDKEWLFSLGDHSGAEAPEFNDSTWRKLEVPYDWSIEGPLDENHPAVVQVVSSDRYRLVSKAFHSLFSHQSCQPAGHI